MMVEKGVPLARGRSGGVEIGSSGGENHPSAVAAEAAEHPQKRKRGSSAEIMYNYKMLLDSVSDNMKAISWAMELQSAWIKFVEDFIYNISKEELEKC